MQRPSAPARLRLIRHRTGRFSARRTPLATAWLAFVATMVLPAGAVVMPSGSNDQDYKNYGATFVAANKAAAFRVLASGSSPEIYASATPINSRFAITSAHLVTGQYGNRSYQVVVGANFISPSAVISVSKVLIHPGYDGTLNSPDVAVLEFSTAFPAFGQATLGTALQGEIVRSAGYGYAMRVGDPIPNSQDGNVRGWNALVRPIGPSGSSDFYYNYNRFYNGSLFEKDGQVFGSDSGSPVFNSQAQLIGLNTSRSSGISERGSSVYLDLTPSSAWTNWILENTALPAALPDLRLAPTNNGTGVRLTWDTAATGYRLQTSESLSGWTNFGELLTGPGTLDDLIAADRPNRFYRLAKP